jgi:hypothetical protein
MKTAKDYWKEKFGEYPQNDCERLSVVMMQEYWEFMKAEFMANYHSNEVCQCEKPVPTMNPNDGRCWNCGLKLVW